MKVRIKNRLKQIGKFKLAFISILLSIVIVTGTIAGALEYVGSGTGSNGSYGTYGGTYNIPTPTAHNIPVGYRFSLVWKGTSTLHYATAAYTATVIDTDALGQCGSDYALNKINYLLVDSDGNRSNYNALSKVAIKRNLSKLTFKTAKLDDATKRTNKNVFKDDGTILSNNLGLSNSNGLFTLPNATTDCDLDSVIKNWATAANVNKVIKLIGSSYCSNNANISSSNNLHKGDGLFIEPLWAFNYGGTKMVCTETEIALFWGNSSGHSMTRKFVSDTSSKTNSSGNLAKTLGYRIPNRVYIKTGTLKEFRDNFNSVNGTAFTLSGSNTATWNSGTSNQLTPNGVINGGYGVALIYSNNKDPDPSRHKFTFKFSTDTGLGAYNPTAQSGYEAVNNLICPSGSKDPVTQVFECKREGTTIKSQTNNDLKNFGTLMQKKDYTRLNSTNQWIARVNGRDRTVLLSQTEKYTFEGLLSKLDCTYTQTEFEEKPGKEEGVVVFLTPNITKAKVDVTYRITQEASENDVTSKIYYNTSTFQVKPVYVSENNYFGYLYQGNSRVVTTFEPGVNSTYGLYNAGSFESNFGMEYKHFRTGDEAYWINNGISNKVYYLDEDAQYDAVSLLVACGYSTSDTSGVLHNLKNGNDQTIMVTSRFIDNTGTVYAKYVEDNKPTLNEGYEYDSNGVIISSSTGKPVLIVSGTANTSYTLENNVNNINGPGQVYNFFKKLPTNSGFQSPILLEDSHTYTLDTLLSAVGADSLRRKNNVTGYLVIGAKPIDGNTKVIVKYHLGGEMSKSFDSMSLISPSDVTSTGEYTVNDAGYICKNGKVISNEYKLSDGTVPVLDTAILGLTSNKYRYKLATSNAYSKWFYNKDGKYTSVSQTGSSVDFGNFYHSYAPYSVATSEGYEVTFYLSWKKIESDCYVYTTELYELEGGSYCPSTSTSSIADKIISNGESLEEDKRYAIKVIVKHNNESFTNHDNVTFKVNVEVGRATNDSEIPISKTISISGTLNKAANDKNGLCFFLVPYSSEFDTNSTYTNIEGFCDGVDNVIFLNEFFDVSDIIITNDILNIDSVKATGINEYDDYSINRTFANNNRFYVKTNVQYSGDSSDVIDVYPGNNEAIMYFFVKPNKASIASKYNILNNINDDVSYADDIPLYSGQSVQEIANFSTNSVYSSYYQTKDEVKFYDSGDKTDQILDNRYIVRNTANGINSTVETEGRYAIDNITSTYTEKDGKGVWSANCNYLSTAKNNTKELSNIKGLYGTLYYPNASVSEHQTIQVSLSQDATIQPSSEDVYPIDLIAPGTHKHEIKGKNSESIKPDVMLYGYDENGNSTCIVKDITDLNESIKIGYYKNYQIKVRFNIRVGINYFKNAGRSAFDTNIPVRIYFGAYAEKEGELFAFGSDNFEFSTAEYRDKVVGIDDVCNHIEEKSRYCSYDTGKQEYIYTLEFWSNYFEFDTYVNNSISFKSEISLANVNLKENEDGTCASTDICEGGVIKNSDKLAASDPIAQFISGGKTYTDFAKSFEYNSDNNQATNIIKFESGSLKATSPNGNSANGNPTYRKGTSVVTSYDLYNYSETDYIGDIAGDVLLIEGNIDTSNALSPKEKLSFTNKIVIPRGHSATDPTKTLGWFKWDVKDIYKSGSYKFNIYQVSYGGNKEYIGMINFNIEDPLSYNTPDTTFTKTKPDGYNESAKFSQSSIPYTATEKRVLRDGDSIKWTGYSYNADALRFETVEYNLKFYVIKSSIYNEQDATEKNIASGYGFTTLYETTSKLTVTVYNGEEKVSSEVYLSSDEFTQAQAVTAFFPEFNYTLMSEEEFKDYVADGVSSDIWKEKSGWNQYVNSDGVNKSVYGSCATLTNDGKGHFVLPYNTSTLTRVHFLPIWYPDTDYSVKFVANEIWTPLGMISLESESNSINVSGTMLDDWHYSSYTYLPDDNEISYIRRIAELR